MHTTLRRVLLLLAVSALVLALAPAALAGPGQGTFEQSPAWACEEAAGLPYFHCINVNGKGKVGNIKVFSPDPRGPQESISFDSRFDDRPCPHDVAPNPDDRDGTWWSVSPDNGGPWVCHHKPSSDD